jgi:hypothetical protein
MEYKIGKRVRTNFLDETGVAVDGYRVYYTMVDGMVDYVEIEKNQYSADAVKAAIEEEIGEHEQLMS